MLSCIHDNAHGDRREMELDESKSQKNDKALPKMFDINPKIRKQSKEEGQVQDHRKGKQPTTIVGLHKRELVKDNEDPTVSDMEMDVALDGTSLGSSTPPSRVRRSDRTERLETISQTEEVRSEEVKRGKMARLSLFLFQLSQSRGKGVGPATNGTRK
jgi:hypothetical protein